MHFLGWPKVPLGSCIDSCQCISSWGVGGGVSRDFLLSLCCSSWLPAREVGVGVAGMPPGQQQEETCPLPQIRHFFPGMRGSPQRAVGMCAASVLTPHSHSRSSPHRTWCKDGSRCLLSLIVKSVWRWP